MSMEANRDIDQFVKQKLIKRTYEYQDSFWGEAEQLILENERKRKRRKGGYLGLIGLALLATIAAGSYLISPSTSFFQEKNQTQQTEISSSIQQTPEPQLIKESVDQRLKTAEENSSNVRFPNLSHQEVLSLAATSSQDVQLLLPVLGKQQAYVLRSKEENVPLQQVAVNRGDLPHDHIPAAHDQYPQQGLVLEREQKPVSIKLLAMEAANQHDQEEEKVFMREVKQVNRHTIELAQIYTEAYKLKKGEKTLGDIRREKIKGRSHHWGLIAGLQLSQGAMGVSGERPSVGIDPLFGISYGRKLSRWLSIHADVRYQPRSGLDYQQSSQSIRYGFGFERNSTSLEIDRIHYLNMPLYVRIHVLPRHYLSVGMSYAYVFQLSGRLTHEQSSSFESPTTLSEVSWGNRKAFRRDDLRLQLGYEYHLGSRTFAGLQASYGLKNLYSDEVGLKARNVQLQLFLRYQLFSH